MLSLLPHERLSISAQQVFLRLFVRLSVLAIFCGLLYSVSRADAAFKTEMDSQSILVTLRTDRACYHVNEPVKLFITIKNVTDHSIFLWFWNAPKDNELTIHDHDGALVAPTIKRKYVLLQSSGHPSGLEPGQNVVENPGTEIAAWGYVLTQPGSYSLTAFRLLGDGRIRVSSNTVRILVTP